MYSLPMMEKNSTSKRPSEGGCWFCNTDDDRSTWSISCQFDCFFHDKCYEEAKKVRSDPEMMIFIREYEDPRTWGIDDTLR